VSANANIQRPQVEERKPRIYIGTRVFDISEKLKAEDLESAVQRGVQRAGATLELSGLQPETFVPFRDSSQNDLIADDKTLRLYAQDIEMLNTAILVVTYLDGLAKDEGVCFELGFARALGVPILIVNTDFIELGLPNGDVVSLDPLISLAATRTVRLQGLTEAPTFRSSLETAQRSAHDQVTASVCDILLQTKQRNIRPAPGAEGRASKFPDSVLSLYFDAGGEVYEWQRRLGDELVARSANKPNLQVARATRYSALCRSPADDVDAVMAADIVLTATDGDECPAGTAFVQGLARGLDKTVWMYDSKATSIVGPGGYVSSRNLMLDHSADRHFTTWHDVLAAVDEL